MQALREHLNSFSPVNKLAPEILCEVFALSVKHHTANAHERMGQRNWLAIPDSLESTYSSLRWLRECAHVCRRWRLVALPCAPLWSSLVIGAFNFNVSAVEAFLSRSQQVMLSVIVDDPESKSQRIRIAKCLKLLIDELHRVEALELMGGELAHYSKYYPSYVQLGNHTAFPQLRRLHQTGPFLWQPELDDRDEDSLEEIKEVKDAMVLKFPALQELHLNSTFPEACTFLVPTLTRFTIKFAHADEDAEDAFQSLLHFLHGTPNLEYLELDGDWAEVEESGDVDNPEPLTVSLPCLQDLVIIARTPLLPWDGFDTGSYGMLDLPSTTRVTFKSLLKVKDDPDYTERSTSFFQDMIEPLHDPSSDTNAPPIRTLAVCRVGSRNGVAISLYDSAQIHAASLPRFSFTLDFASLFGPSEPFSLTTLDSRFRQTTTGVRAVYRTSPCPKAGGDHACQTEWLDAYGHMKNVKMLCVRGCRHVPLALTIPHGPRSKPSRKTLFPKLKTLLFVLPTDPESSSNPSTQWDALHSAMASRMAHGRKVEHLIVVLPFSIRTAAYFPDPSDAVMESLESVVDEVTVYYDPRQNLLGQLTGKAGDFIPILQGAGYCIS